MSDASKAPTHRIYTLLARGDAEKPFWLNIGSAWPHGDGKGFNLSLDALPTDAKLVLREIKEEPKEPEPVRRAAKR